MRPHRRPVGVWTVFLTTGHCSLWRRFSGVFSCLDKCTTFRGPRPLPLVLLHVILLALNDSFRPISVRPSALCSTRAACPNSGSLLWALSNSGRSGPGRCALSPLYMPIPWHFVYLRSLESPAGLRADLTWSESNATLFCGSKSEFIQNRKSTYVLRIQIRRLVALTFECLILYWIFHSMWCWFHGFCYTELLLVLPSLLWSVFKFEQRN